MNESDKAKNTIPFPREANDDLFNQWQAKLNNFVTKHSGGGRMTSGSVNSEIELLAHEELPVDLLAWIGAQALARDGFTVFLSWTQQVEHELTGEQLEEAEKISVELNH